MLIHCKDVYNCSCIAREFRKDLSVAQNTRILSCFWKVLIIKWLSDLMLFEVLGGVEKSCD